MPTYTNEQLTNKNIFAISDIHGDIMGLITMLHINIGLLKYEHNDNYETMYSNLDLKINITIDKTNNFPFIVKSENNNFDCLLGFTINKNIINKTIIVIIGDIIDGYRTNFTYNNNGKRFGEFIHEEIKILLLINKLIYEGCDIIKLIGNHELMNMNLCSGRYNNYTDYISPFALNENNNITVYQNNESYEINRSKLFNKSNSLGVELLMYNNLYCIVKLGDFIFCHGGIKDFIDKKNYLNYYDENDNQINDNYINIDLINKSMIYLLKNMSFIGEQNCNFSDILWDRQFGELNKINEFNKNIIDTKKGNFIKNFYNYFTKQNNYTKPINYHKYFEDLIESLKYFNDYNDKTCLIIGHCPQCNYCDEYDTFNSTFCEIKTIDSNKITLSQNKLYVGKKQFIYDKHNKCDTAVFGITVSCIDINDNKYVNETETCTIPKIIRIDHSSSRAFDSDCMYNKLNNNVNIDTFSKIFVSRMPQVIKISTNTNNKREFEIIRALTKNIKIFQKRNINNDKFNYFIDNETQLYMQKFNYYNKYIKYKNKYIKMITNLSNA